MVISSVGNFVAVHFGIACAAALVDSVLAAGGTVILGCSRC